MADKKGSDTGRTVFTFLLLIGVCIWIGTIIAAKGEQQLKQACKPVEAATDLLDQVAVALVNDHPEWALYVQRYLVSGCYYLFSVVLSQAQGDGTILEEEDSGSQTINLKNGEPAGRGIYTE